MLLDEFIEYIKQGREIEFSYKNSKYFISWCNYELKTYSIYSEKKQKILFEGKLIDLLSYKFLEDDCFNDNFEDFAIEYIY